jgi:hypothetical protein
MPDPSGERLKFTWAELLKINPMYVSPPSESEEDS